jgi:hypothetical protein
MVFRPLYTVDHCGMGEDDLWHRLRRKTYTCRQKRNRCTKVAETVRPRQRLHRMGAGCSDSAQVAQKGGDGTFS